MEPAQPIGKTPEQRSSYPDRLNYIKQRRRGVTPTQLLKESLEPHRQATMDFLTTLVQGLSEQQDEHDGFIAEERARVESADHLAPAEKRLAHLNEGVKEAQEKAQQLQGHLTSQEQALAQAKAENSYLQSQLKQPFRKKRDPWRIDAEQVAELGQKACRHISGTGS